MAGFKGQSENSIDAKGRVAVPAKMRAAFPESAPNYVVLSRGFDRCVHLYTAPAWEEIERQVNKLSPLDKAYRDFKRYMIGTADDFELDKQGRVTIPPSLRRYAGLEAGGTALITGVGDYIEIWNPEAYDAYLDGADSFESLARTVRDTMRA
jgi:MraZ protein